MGVRRKKLGATEANHGRTLAEASLKLERGADPKTRNRSCKTVCRDDLGPIAAIRGGGGTVGVGFAGKRMGYPPL
jgi:hypothetical protein